MSRPLIVRDLGIVDYQMIHDQMKQFTHDRDEKTTDELWFLQHSPVFTLGQAGKEEHILQKTDIPIIKSDRGGQVTYHGPGQLVGYCLFDIARLGIDIRAYVTAIENLFIDYLASFNIKAISKCDAPGVYVDNKKIASIGLRVRKGRSYHGFSFNVDMDLTPFQYINPCGYAGQEMTTLKLLGVEESITTVQASLLKLIIKQFKLHIA